MNNWLFHCIIACSQSQMVNQYVHPAIIAATHAAGILHFNVCLAPIATSDFKMGILAYVMKTITIQWAANLVNNVMFYAKIAQEDYTVIYFYLFYVIIYDFGNSKRIAKHVFQANIGNLLKLQILVFVFYTTMILSQWLINK